MESSSTSAQQDEPLDLSSGANDELTEQQNQVLQMMEVYGKMLQQSMLTMLMKSVIDASSAVPISNALPAGFHKQTEESAEKENTFDTTKSKTRSIDYCQNHEFESTPSPTDDRRRTSSGKIDRRMIGKNCTRSFRVEANARERNRVQQLSKKFDQLREILPVEGDKISKLATLKVATAYIAFLASLLKDDNENEEDDLRQQLQIELESAKSLRK